MPRVTFTPHLQRFLDAPPVDVAGATVAEALEAVFAANPRLRGYVVDERGRLRKHVTVFVGDSPIRDRAAMSDALEPATEIFVLQALSGGESICVLKETDRDATAMGGHTQGPVLTQRRHRLGRPHAGVSRRSRGRGAGRWS